MICEKCGGKLLVNNTYRTTGGKTQRLECVDCLTVHTAVTVVVNSDPDRGEGAAALAKRINKGEKPWTSSAS